MEEKIMQEQENLKTGETASNSGAAQTGHPHTGQAAAPQQADNEDTDADKLRSQLDELKDKYLRQVADFDNFRKRTARERIELIQTAGKEVISSLLPILDDADRAEKQLQSATDIEALKEGVMLILGKLKSTLQAKGLKPMESIGTEFSPEFHEAISEIPAPSPEFQGKVVDEVEKGYYLNDKIIRFAKVIVGK